MKILIPVVLIIAVGLYYFIYYPPVVLKGKTEAALQRFATSVQLKDRDAIAESLNQLLTENATVKLDVSFTSFGTQGTSQPTVQNFGKSQFILFIDNVLYPLTDYGYTPQLKTFELSEDHKTATVSFSSVQWAEGASFMGGMRLAMRYHSQSDCTGAVQFGDSVQLNEVQCTVSLRPMVNESPAEVMKRLGG